MKEQNNIKTVSVGIPAYNEEGNVGYLLKALLSQKERNFVLKEIVVVSDGSTDKTNEIVSGIHAKDARVRLVVMPVRSGAYKAQNRIIEEFSGDILVMLDADILPENDMYIQYMIEPFLHDKDIGIVSGKRIPLLGETFVERVINFSDQIKQDIFARMNDGDNVYLCHGDNRAFRGDFAKTIKWPPVLGEDAYSYFYCKEQGLRFYYEPRARVVYRAPQTLKDHLSRSTRFFQSERRMSSYFSNLSVERAYKLPLMTTVRIIVKHAIQHPVLFCGYLGMYCFAKISSRMQKDAAFAWKPATSSKTLVKK